MLSQYIRLINSDNAVLTDNSLDNQDTLTTLDMEMVAAEDYYYFGQRLPFNNFFIQILTANATASLLSLQYWENNSSTWRDCLDVLDGTSVNGVTFAKSGVVQFATDSRYSWDRSGNSYEDEYPTELSALNITNVYWLRLKVSADTDAGTTAKRIIYAFTSNQNVNSHDPKVSNFYTSFATGKTEWNDEIITASMSVARDLKKKNIILNRGQIIELEDVSIPTDWKTLENIYRALGGDYADKKEEAKSNYNETIELKSMTKDCWLDGRVNSSEIDQPVVRELLR